MRLAFTKHKVNGCLSPHRLIIKMVLIPQNLPEETFLNQGGILPAMESLQQTYSSKLCCSGVDLMRVAMALGRLSRRPWYSSMLLLSRYTLLISW